MNPFSPKYNVNFNFFGFRFKNSGTVGRLAVTLSMALLVFGAILGGLAYGFMYLWAWYVPVFWAGAPMLDYWHSLVTMLLFMAVLNVDGGRKNN